MIDHLVPVCAGVTPTGRRGGLSAGRARRLARDLDALAQSRAEAAVSARTYPILPHPKGRTDA